MLCKQVLMLFINLFFSVDTAPTSPMKQKTRQNYVKLP